MLSKIFSTRNIILEENLSSAKRYRRARNCYKIDDKSGRNSKNLQDIRNFVKLYLLKQPNHSTKKNLTMKPAKEISETN